MSRIDGVDGGVRQRLLNHLGQCVQGVGSMTPLSFTAMAGIPVAPGMGNVPSPASQHPHPADVNNNQARLLQNLVAARLAAAGDTTGAALLLQGGISLLARGTVPPGARPHGPINQGTPTGHIPQAPAPGHLQGPPPRHMPQGPPPGQMPQVPSQSQLPRTSPPGHLPQRVPCHLPQGAPGHLPQGAPGHLPQGAPGHLPQGAPGHLPQGAPGHRPQGIPSGHRPQNTSLGHRQPGPHVQITQIHGQQVSSTSHLPQGPPSDNSSQNLSKNHSSHGSSSSLTQNIVTPHPNERLHSSNNIRTPGENYPIPRQLSENSTEGQSSNHEIQNKFPHFVNQRSHMSQSCHSNKVMQSSNAQTRPSFTQTASSVQPVSNSPVQSSTHSIGISTPTSQCLNSQLKKPSIIAAPSNNNMSRPSAFTAVKRSSSPPRCMGNQTKPSLPLIADKSQIISTQSVPVTASVKVITPTVRRPVLVNSNQNRSETILKAQVSLKPVDQNVTYEHYPKKESSQFAQEEKVSVIQPKLENHSVSVINYSANLPKEIGSSSQLPCLKSEKRPLEIDEATTSRPAKVVKTESSPSCSFKYNLELQNNVEKEDSDNNEDKDMWRPW